MLFRFIHGWISLSPPPLDDKLLHNELCKIYLFILFKFKAYTLSHRHSSLSRIQARWQKHLHPRTFWSAPHLFTSTSITTAASPSGTSCSCPANCNCTLAWPVQIAPMRSLSSDAALAALKHHRPNPTLFSTFPRAQLICPRKDANSLPAIAGLSSAGLVALPWQHTGLNASRLKSVHFPSLLLTKD